MNPSWLQKFTVIIFTIIAFLLLGAIAYLTRESLLIATIMLSNNAYLPRALDKVFLIILGTLWLAGWFVFEGYINNGIAKKNILARFLRVLGWELVALFAFSILAYLFTDAGINWAAVVLLSVALLAGVVLLFIARRLFSTPQKI